MGMTVPPAATGSQTRRALVVDDDADVAAVTGEYLEFLDGDLLVDTVGDPAAVLEGHDIGQYDCLVTDHHMPGIDGAALCRAVRKRVPGIACVLFSSVAADRVADLTGTETVAHVRKGGRAGRYERLATRIDDIVAGVPMAASDRAWPGPSDRTAPVPARHGRRRPLSRPRVSAPKQKGLSGPEREEEPRLLSR